MASFTLQRPSVFPNGTVVSAYAVSNWPDGVPAGAPRGSAAASGTVASDKVELTGLTENVAYTATAEVGGVRRYVGFLVPGPRPGELAASGMGVVLDGTKTTARPTGYKVITWVQTEEPEHAADGDIWIEA